MEDIYSESPITISDTMRKALSPLMAVVMLVAFTLAVSALLGTWFTSMTKTETEIIEKGATEQINCTSAILDVVEVICYNSTQELRVAIHNLGDVELYNFSTLARVNNTFYENSTGGPNSTHPLDPGEQTILTYYCSRTAYCASDATVEWVRVSPSNCPQAWMKKTVSVGCNR